LAVKELPQPHADAAFGFTVTCTTAPKWCKFFLPFLMQEFEQKAKEKSIHSVTSLVLLQVIVSCPVYDLIISHCVLIPLIRIEKSQFS
jgi:hypothetical protein